MKSANNDKKICFQKRNGFSTRLSVIFMAEEL